MQDQLKELHELTALIAQLEKKADKLKAELKEAFAPALDSAREYRHTFGGYELHLWLKSMGKVVDEEAFAEAHPYYAQQWPQIVKARKAFEQEKKPATMLRVNAVQAEAQVSQDVIEAARAIVQKTA